jgi:hypothetical protein
MLASQDRQLDGVQGNGQVYCVPSFWAKQLWAKQLWAKRRDQGDDLDTCDTIFRRRVSDGKLDLQKFIGRPGQTTAVGEGGKASHTFEGFSPSGTTITPRLPHSRAISSADCVRITCVLALRS